ncbi:HTTM domain-containing protein [Flavobacterium sp. 3HN19-14]|uniref:HTTM domain-containing protein n=1 Tax=Flavobacterium sp. 3HN19-14 TaxID=3448133 RepID=UPI003EE2C1D7
MTKKLLSPIDNAPLILFRICFGLLLACEAFGAILTGWVKNNFIIPKFTFSYIGFEWVQPLPGNGMYIYFAFMGIFGILVMLGYRYRLSMSLYTLLWTGAYLMQKSSYNNHYYLVLLICVIMIFLPANAWFSLDAKRNPKIKNTAMPYWCSFMMIFQVAIVYFFAAISKLYPGWMDGSFINLAFHGSPYFKHAASVLGAHWFQLFIAYSGFGFDLLIVPLLLWRKTRTTAFIGCLIFHLFNSIFFQIGIFPFLALSFVVFFYPPESIRKIFFPKKPILQDDAVVSRHANVLKYCFIPYFIIQLALPVRHYFIKGDVLWTEEGHRLSWRMMLRMRHGMVQFKVVDKKTNVEEIYNYHKVLTPKQCVFVQSKPDGIWQMAQYIKKEYEAKGQSVRVFVNCKVALNDDAFMTFINPETDLASAKWDYWFHNEWILLYDDNGNLIP